MKFCLYSSSIFILLISNLFFRASSCSAISGQPVAELTENIQVRDLVFRLSINADLSMFSGEMLRPDDPAHPSGKEADGRLLCLGLSTRSTSTLGRGCFAEAGQRNLPGLFLNQLT